MALMVHMHKRTMHGGRPTIHDGGRLLS
jgi:hypothetical protein